MITHVHGNVVSGSVPRWLALHLVVQQPTVDLDTFEGDAFYLALIIVAVDDGKAGCYAFISDIPEGDIFHATAWSSTIFLIIAHFHLRDTSLFNLLDADIVKDNVADKVVIAAVDGQTALIVHLRLCLSKNVDVLVAQVLDGVTTLCISMDADEDRVRHVGPECGVAHGDIVRRTLESLACGIGCGAVIGVAAEDAVEENVARAAKDIQSITPRRMRDTADIVEGDILRLANGAGVEHKTVDKHILRAIDMSALVAPFWSSDTAP